MDVIQTIVCVPVRLARQRIILDVLTQPPEPLTSQKSAERVLRKGYEIGQR